MKYTVTVSEDGRKLKSTRSDHYDWYFLDKHSTNRVYNLCDRGYEILLDGGCSNPKFSNCTVLFNQKTMKTKVITTAMTCTTDFIDADGKHIILDAKYAGIMEGEPLRNGQTQDVFCISQSAYESDGMYIRNLNRWSRHIIPGTCRMSNSIPDRRQITQADIDSLNLHRIKE